MKGRVFIWLQQSQDHSSHDKGFLLSTNACKKTTFFMNNIQICKLEGLGILLNRVQIRLSSVPGASNMALQVCCT